MTGQWLSVLRRVVLAALLVGCTPAGSSLPTELAIGPSPSAPPTPSATATPPSPTSRPAEPTDPPAPTQTAIACPADLPTTLASVDELADPACYGDTELTVDGWLTDGDVATIPIESQPAWTNSWLALASKVPTVGEWMAEPVFFGHPGPARRIEIVVRPADRTEIGELNAWVRVSGHFQDAAASACRPARPVENSFERKDCSTLFVLSSIERLDHEADCPNASPLPVAAYLSADVTCFIGREVILSGWEVERGGLGGSGPVYRPTLPSSLRLADSILSAEPPGDGHPEVFVYAWRIAGSGVSFDRRKARVEVTGSFGHPISQQCRAETVEPSTWSPPQVWAHDRCGALFVITAVIDRD